LRLLSKFSVKITIFSDVIFGKKSFKNFILGQEWWLKPIILATLQVAIRRFEANPGEKNLQDLILTNDWAQWSVPGIPANGEGQIISWKSRPVQT
jgi:hypothetical protein